MTPDELKAIRKAAGLTQAELGARLRKSRLSIANWENSKYRIPSDLAEQMATAGLSNGKEVEKVTSKERKRDENIASQYAKMRTWPVVKSDVDPHINPHTGEKFPSSPTGMMTHAQVVSSMLAMKFEFTPGAMALIFAEFPDILKGE
jgi:transcriptional regulator with XRE-family HTH domain